MRQWLQVFFKPHQIAHIEIATAYDTFSEMLGLGQSRSSDLLTDDASARAWLVEAGNFHLVNFPRAALIVFCVRGAGQSQSLFQPSVFLLKRFGRAIE